MKYIFIYPPTIIDFTPIIGIPQLMGILENKNIKTKIYDLNIDFLNYFTDKKSKKLYQYFIENIFSNKFINEQNEEIKNLIKNLKTKEKILLKEHSKIIQNTTLAKKILKSKKLFYNPFLCNWAFETLKNCLNVLLSFVWKIESLMFFEQDTNPSMNTSLVKLDIKELIKYIQSNANIYKIFYEENIRAIIDERPNCIGISINCYSQLIPALTLCHFIKRELDVHINIGGTLFSTDYENIKNLEEYFNLFFDSISIGDSEKTVLELSEFLQNKMEIEKVNNLIYLDKTTKKIVKNHIDNYTNLNEQPFPSYNGYKKNDYLSPEFVIQIRASKACYWGKCTFCNCSFGKEIEFKTPDKLIDEIEYLSKKYESKYFSFWDNALPPAYLSQMADLLIKRDLKINYSLYLRLEKEFTKELLSKLKKSGLIKVHWGLDSASERILEYINKGIDINTTIKVLTDSHNVGIFNFVHIILGFPTETKEDLEETINFLKKHKKIITTTVVSPSLIFAPGSEMFKKREELKKQIYTTLEERKKYTDIAYNIFGKSNTRSLVNLPWYRYGNITLLYCSKYSNKKFKYLDFYNNLLTKNNYIKKLFLKIGTRIYYD